MEIIVNFDEGKCKSNGVTLGQPCEYSSGFATVNLNNASNYKLLKVYDAVMTYTVYFAPKCELFTPKEGEVVVEPSIPLYRFLKGKKSVQIEFAVFGTKQTNQILLKKEAITLCSWNGTIESQKNEGCKDMTIDEAQNRMIFKTTIFRGSNEDYVTYSWGPLTSPLKVSLDWIRGGEAPEVAKCKSKLSENFQHRLCMLVI
ncbi:diagnostic antigen gp50 [Echinococcus multilocularis]|uniref:Diagnostic antigen gp50 n=1 Tax=Echinococcus multilocularis TaxID=6211 RepID=A0A068Y525_ECHMU|nr:diagnostic antigen gp50 [Echinococcus multilocularis]